MQPIDQATLAAIGGQSQLSAAQGFATTMAQTAQVLGDMSAKRDELALATEKWQAQKKVNETEAQAAELDLHIKRTELVGKAAIGVQELLRQSSDPRVIASEYADYRESQPKSVRQLLPENFQSVEDLSKWATMTAQQSAQGVPYLNTLKEKGALKEWEYKVSALTNVEQGVATPDQMAYVNWLHTMSPQAVRAPSNPQVENAFISMGGFSLKGILPESATGKDVKLIDSLSKDDQLAVANDIAMRVNALAEIARTRNTPLDANHAYTRAVQQMFEEGRLVPTETVLGSSRIPKAAHKYLPKGWEELLPELTKGSTLTYVSNPSQYSTLVKQVAEAEEKAAMNPDEPEAPKDLKAGEVREVSGYLWRINPQTGKPQYVKKP